MLYAVRDYSRNPLPFREVGFVTYDHEEYVVTTDSNGWCGVNLDFDEIMKVGIKVYRDDCPNPEEYLQDDEDFWLMKGEIKRPSGAKTTNVGGVLYFDFDNL